MRKMMQWVLAATLLCGTSVFTACSESNDNPSEDQKKEVRKEFIGHVRTDLKDLAENLKFKAWPNMNGFLINFNNQVLLNEAYGHELEKIFNQKILESIKPVEEGSDLAKLGYAVQATVDLTKFNYKFTADSATTFKVEPAENFEIAFYNAVTNVNVDILFQTSGATYNVLSSVISSKTKGLIAVQLLLPEKFTFVLSNDKDGTMRPWLTGTFTNTLKKATDRSFYKLTEDEWTATGNTVTGHGGEKLDFTIKQDPANHKGYNNLTFIKDGRKMVDFVLEMGDSDGTGDYAQASSDSSNLFDLITTLISGTSVDNLQITTLDHMTTTMKISNVQQFMKLHNHMTQARRSGADQQTINDFATQMNEIITCSVTDKQMNQTIPMRFAAAKIGVDWWALPAMNFPDENGFVPITNLLDKESMEYAINVIDHASAPMQQTTIVVRQLIQLLNKLMSYSSNPTQYVVI